MKTVAIVAGVYFVALIAYGLFCDFRRWLERRRRIRARLMMLNDLAEHSGAWAEHPGEALKHGGRD